MNLTLPFPPSTNRMYRMFKNRILIAADGRKYRETVAGHVTVARSHGFPLMPLTGRLAVHILVTPPDKRRRDLDNMFKSCLDCLTHAGVWEDDSQIDDLRITRGDVMQNQGAVIVQITELVSV